MNKRIEALDALMIAQAEVQRVLTQLISDDPWRAATWRNMRSQSEDNRLYAAQTRVSEIVESAETRYGECSVADY
jgi:hypothetical protein